MDGTDGTAIEGTVQIEGADTDVAVIMLSESNCRRAESQGGGSHRSSAFGQEVPPKTPGDLVRDYASKSDSQSAQLANC